MYILGLDSKCNGYINAYCLCWVIISHNHLFQQVNSTWCCPKQNILDLALR